jgi:hypothetical protein
MEQAGPAMTWVKSAMVIPLRGSQGSVDGISIGLPFFIRCQGDSGLMEKTR